MGPTPAVADVRRALRACLSGAGSSAVEEGSLVLVACSGGADSMALAAALAFEGPRLGLRAGAVTVDHGLQEGSEGRAAAVASTMRGLGLAPTMCRRVEVGRAGGPEAAARDSRYAALEAAARESGAAVVLLGHSLDDQAETVLLGLARGSGGRSLAGMAPVRGRLRRPLLGLDRLTLRAACLDAGLVPWDDPHNLDATFTRVRVRERALPVLEEELGPGVAAALARTANQLRDDGDLLDALAADALGAAQEGGGGLSVERLAALHTALRSRVLRLAALGAGCPPTDLRAGHITALESLVLGWHGQAGVDLPGRAVATRACGRLHIARRPDRDQEPMA